MNNTVPSDGVSEHRLPHKIVAEALGTGFLVAAVVGSGIMAAKLAGGNQALALLCNTIPTGAILVVLIIVFGGISGAHFNPAVTAAFWMRKELTGREALSFMAAQIAGGILGTLAAHLMFDETLFQLSLKARSGPSQWFSEFVAAFGLLLTIFGTLRWRPDAVPFTVGLYITSAYWFTASTSFANPAVTIARALSNTFAGIRLADVPAFIVAQLAGAVCAIVIAKWLLQPGVKSPAGGAQLNREPTIPA
ncbi:MAG: MIP/aquaporin family protein [Rhodomicrobium sp.]|jgi:glycerol uptake facilitator-like aquaporin